MKIQIICIGKLKEKYWTEAVAEYSKRLQRFCTLEIVEMKEARLPDKASAAEALSGCRIRPRQPPRRM